MPEHEALKKEYGQTKIKLASSSQHSLEYGQKKNPLIRRILRAAGWTDTEIDKKESLDYRVPHDDLPY
ncbi:hypothetical protein A1O7_01346 [Cladophialophora yegresii CBS 114405]|uniref:Uncharacterized protein n=1 Tax=Cladophialophora yegresii CBS 114405 TaxID=1182544 RepID=W9WA57_9EURO|nr:uncharacterized protein A1O7_01346 [Cladophialophora yegresii CBS 114405]EXJ65007.1 hypothetical protein A1O7_01346 [Cladophialophora yegresii CBS 114405]